MKKILKALLIIITAVVILGVAFILWLTITEFDPDPIMDTEIAVAEDYSERLSADRELNILSWNTGYSGLGKDSDFFMDGGENVKSADRDTVSDTLQGIYDTVYGGEVPYDVVLLQEVDVNSSRTYGINELEKLSVYNTAFAYNYKAPFVPYPLPPIGRVNSGLMTGSVFEVAEAQRHALPCPFSWPVSAANLKRCLLVSYIPIEGSDRQLVIVNLHLEAYDDGEGKIAQTKQLMDFVQSEYEKGNYVIAGGDWNQVFPGGFEVFPNTHEDLWKVGSLTEDILPGGWSFAFDLSVPTCRLLNQPYEPSDTENTQYYVIDGFMLSPNVELVSVKTLDEGFTYSDHNPVSLCVKIH
ncbi:MAG: endonuclease [Oscillospiraceae bacterium]|nr:endonuclease [Oscillospiraceae bacterium]